MQEKQYNWHVERKIKGFVLDVLVQILKMNEKSDFRAVSA
jgi:hypothetical protein